MDVMDELQRIFKALSERTRLEMLFLLLNEEELCVCHFMAVLKLTQSKASRHLRYLYNCELIKDRREGLWVYYRISDRLSCEAKSLIKSFKEITNGGAYKDISTKLTKAKERLKRI